MAGKLAVYVSVDDKQYGPDDDVPADVAKRITNADAWETPPAAAKRSAKSDDDK